MKATIHWGFEREFLDIYVSWLRLSSVTTILFCYLWQYGKYVFIGCLYVLENCPLRSCSLNFTQYCRNKRSMASTGIEPATFALLARRSNQLS